MYPCNFFQILVQINLGQTEVISKRGRFAPSYSNTAATCAGNVFCKTFFKYYKIYFQDRVMLLEAKCSQIVYIVYECQLSGILFFVISVIQWSILKFLLLNFVLL